MWARLATASLGAWLMAAPAVLGYGGAAAISDRIVGPLVASVTVVAMWEVVRGMRWLVVPGAAWQLIAPGVLGYASTAAIHSVLVGVALGVLILPAGRRTQRFGGGWPAAFRPPAASSLRRSA